MNFSAISRSTVVGRALRAPLRLIPPGTIVPILQGRARGMRWIVGSSDHGCWLGSYEEPKRRRFEREVRPGHVVYDLGANVGFYTLLASRLAGPAGRVVAFEPWPRNLEYLRRHVAINGLGNVTIVPAAVGNVDGRAAFGEGPTNAMGGLAPSGGEDVEVVSLDRLVSAGVIPPPQVMKIDIEGGELRALEGAAALLGTIRPVVFLATHGVEIHAACCDVLRAHGYTLSTIDSSTVETTDELIALVAGTP